MNINLRKSRKLLVLGMLAATYALLSGCGSSTARFHPDFERYRPGIDQILVMPPQIAIFEELADGSHFFRETDSHRAERQLQESISRMLTGRFKVQPAGGAVLAEKTASEVQALFHNVNRSIQLHTYGPQLFPEKCDRFVYSLGNIDSLLSQTGADAVVMALGHQTISAAHPKTWVSIALVEPGGQVLWYSLQGAKRQMDLSDAAQVSALVKQAVASFLEVRS